MYKSPIDVLIEDVKMQFEKGVDEQVHQAVVHVGINVDKAELLRALAYDREQYVKGYADGSKDAVKHGQWEIERKNWRKCTNCGFGRNIDTQRGWNYCPNCGAKMEVDSNENDHCDD